MESGEPMDDMEAAQQLPDDVKTLIAEHALSLCRWADRWRERNQSHGCQALVQLAAFSGFVEGVTGYRLKAAEE
jgi:hypothetical protein